MRSEDNAEDDGIDCEDSLVLLACSMGTDDCPAKCQEKEDTTDDEDVVVKSGDLAVTATASSTRKIMIGGASDTDSLKFKTSEDVEISKITLERFGYSSKDDIENVRLEDSDGTVIAEAKTVNSKDQVVLTLKKDYRKVDGTLNATIVVETVSGAKVGRTIGFKVVSAESTAKNLNLDDYDPYTYEMVEYDGSTVTFTIRDNGKDYNYEEGNSYEVAKFKVKAGDNAIAIKGFTLSNEDAVVAGSQGKLDIQDYIDDVKVLANGEAVKAKYSINRDDELVIALSDEYELDSKANVTFTVEVSMQGLDEYKKYVHYEIAETSDFNAIEKKTGARVQVNGLGGTWSTFVFLGGKIKITNTRLGNIDAAQGSEDVVVAEWNITVPEALDKVTFTLHGTSGANAVDAMRVAFGNNEFDGKITYNSDASIDVLFENIDIEKSSKVKFIVDIKDDDKYLTNKFSFNTFGPKTISKARYEESRENATSEIAGSISFGDITVQAAKGSLENDKSDDTVTFLAEESNRKVVFEGTVSARKADIYLKEFAITGTKLDNKDDMTFYLFLDGEEVANADFDDPTSFSNVLVKAGESMKVKVEAEVDAEEATADRRYSDFSLILDGEDVNNVDIASLVEPLAEIKVTNKAQVKVEAETAAKTVLLKGKNKKVATFTLKPEDNDEDIVLENFTLVVSWTINGTETRLNGDALRVKVDGVEEKDYSTVNTANYGSGIEYETSIDLKSSWVVVEVTAKAEYNNIKVALVNANDRWVYKDAVKSFEDVLVRIDSQETDNVETKWFFSIEKSDSDYSVTNVKLYTGSYNTTGDALAVSWSAMLVKNGDEITDGADFSHMNLSKNSSDEYITAISYEVSSSAVCTPSAAKWTLTTTGNTTDNYSCPEGYYTGDLNAINSSNSWSACNKLENSWEWQMVLVNNVPYVVSGSATTWAILRHGCQDGFTLSWNICVKVEYDQPQPSDMINKTWEETAKAVVCPESWKTTVVILKSQYNDYFKVGSSYATLFAKD